MGVAIERNGSQAEVDERYVADFVKDGWAVVGGAVSVSALAGSKDAELILALTEENESLKARIKDLEGKLAANPVTPVDVDEHSLKVMALDDKDAVESYIKEHFGAELDKRGSLETVKDKALAVINESGRTD